MFTPEVEVRGDARVFAGSDTAHTAVGSVAISDKTPALTPLMIEVVAEGATGTGALVVWDGVTPCAAVAILAIDHDGVSEMCTYYKSGTFDVNAIVWPEGIDEALKQNAFLGTPISVA